ASVVKAVGDSMSISEKIEDDGKERKGRKKTADQIRNEIEILRQQMLQAAAELEFEAAARLRDMIMDLEGKL
ncbi:MAG: UvrB/UvrC motif-containing protein, partial [Christensenellaceae bacterium]|nr:UvrB/UvrC motif-containing protein [Christensenellaceae bacterium]